MKIIIIGGGVIGLSCAFYLQRSGAEIIILDKSNMQDGCSYGNAGMIVPSHIIPLAAPGMIAKGIRWMFNPESPFYIKPRFNRALFSWGWHFYRSANQAHVQQSIPVLKEISLLSKALFQSLSTEPGFEFDYCENGLLMLYKTARMEEEEGQIAHLANQAGIVAKPLIASEITKLEPNVELNVKGGVYYPGDAHLDPGLLLGAIKKQLIKKGAEIYPFEFVREINHHKGIIKYVKTAKRSYKADEIVLAAGSWSGELARSLGLNIPLQAGKGYSITIDQSHRSPKYPSILTEAKVAVTPMTNKLRIAGTMEIGGADQHINPRRVKGILQAVPEYFSNLQVKMPSSEQIWRGLRPCSPDGLPYIGRSVKYKNLTIATGHAMMGLSLAPATGKLVSEIIFAKPLSMNTTAFHPGRFS